MLVLPSAPMVVLPAHALGFFEPGGAVQGACIVEFPGCLRLEIEKPKGLVFKSWRYQHGSIPNIKKVSAVCRETHQLLKAAGLELGPAQQAARRASNYFRGLAVRGIDIHRV
jgi:hypothetical protein